MYLHGAFYATDTSIPHVRFITPFDAISGPLVKTEESLRILQAI